jgi:hypothetical protein
MNIVPPTVTVGAPELGAEPALPAGPSVPILAGWNIWDVWQSQAPIDPTPGTLDEQLRDWIADAVGAPASDLQPSVVSSRAAGEAIASRSAFQELAGPVALGVGGSALVKRTIAFHYPDERTTRPWPSNTNLLLDAAFLPATSAPTGASAPSSSGAADAGSSGGLMLALGLGLGAVLLLRGRRRR